MNIGFDGKRAANNLTGLGNYSRSLISALGEYFHQNHYFVYTPKIKQSGQILAFFKQDHIHLQLPLGQSISFLWRSLGIRKQLLRDQVSLYHGLSNEIPLGLDKYPFKTIVTIHDLIFLRRPQNYQWTDRIIYNFKSKYACRHADRIIAISEQTKRDIIEYYGTEPSKIEVLYQTCDDSFKDLLSTAQKEIVRKKYDLPKNFILNVGTIEARKNLLLIVQALQTVSPDIKLVVVGKKQAYAAEVIKEIERTGLTDRVIFLKDIPFADLPAIYQLARIFVYPSFYEGFGIPIIEALYGGIPVIAATGSCLEEAGGPDSMYINPNNAAELASAISKILEDPSLALNMRNKGIDFAQQFNTQPLTQQLMNCYTKIVSKP